MLLIKYKQQSGTGSLGIFSVSCVYIVNLTCYNHCLSSPNISIINLVMLVIQCQVS